jgi:hypothetical protein
MPEAGTGGAGGGEGGEGGTAGSGGSSGASGEGGEGGMSGAGGSVPDPVVPLPEGSRVVDEVVNLVDAPAAEELDAFLIGGEPMHAVLRQRLVKSVNLFLEHYEEEVDFLIVVTDHPVAGATLAGAFESLNRRAEPGGGNEIEIALGGYRTTGRLRAVIGINKRDLIGPPLGHEILHEWAAHFDPALGFGGPAVGVHWGFTSVHGRLGGFDGSTLKCQTPANAAPPGCTPESNGRTRYVVDHFFPHDNTREPYSPLELYVMGLLPKEEVPETFMVLEGAEEVPDSFDPDTETIVVEADGLGEIAFADVLARHGEMALLPEDERAFSAAFVVVSSEPAPDQIMNDVAEWAAGFGNRGTSPVVPSFETETGGRATMDTTLPPRRTESSVVPEPRVRFDCNVLTQDCPRAELACFDFTPSYCALSGGVEEGQSCDRLYQCAAGLDCFSGPSDPDAYVCTPYCDPEDTTSALACTALCPGNELRFVDADDTTVGAVCLN